MRLVGLVSRVRLALLGLALLLAGWALAVLMVMGVLPPSYPVAFAAYGASVVGLALGVYGLMQHARAGRHR